MDRYACLDGYRDEAGRFTQLPGKRQKIKQDLMLESLAEYFRPGLRYSEKEINETLNAHHTFNDPATLRRMMFGRKLLNRTVDGRAYWRTSK
ncbi:DUF2087 domain-containing protein [Lewinella sp. W8]|uniref:DUF2087 domain-containing protein n=1 Tax=Lewinella sp. W8 TaxID=2528208 RepID=UPI001067C2DF|nr:DUF2087 domain-containing protein [Lewinella sp. W8]MTB53568.1 DUF2087 domain-containing protein [Lewinella sp. W8]